MTEVTKTPKEATAKKVASRAESYDIAKSDETFDLAKDLAKFIKENKLTTQVQGKEFVNVEGWQYAGSRLGIVPIVEHVINLSTDQGGLNSNQGLTLGTNQGGLGGKAGSGCRYDCRRPLLRTKKADPLSQQKITPGVGAWL